MKHSCQRPPCRRKSCSTRRRSRRTLSRIAHELIERNPDLDDVALVGIHTRGVRSRSGSPPDRRARRRRGRTRPVDITFHRDDVAVRGGGAPEHAQPVVRATRLDFELEGATVVLVDDVLYTGRTIRAAIEALFDYGRPARVQLAVLADRGHRELPIRPDYVGKNLPTARGERVQVQLLEVDEIDRVLLSEPEEGADDRSASSTTACRRRAGTPPLRLDRRGHARRRRAPARPRRSFERSLEREVKKLPTLKGRLVVNVSTSRRRARRRASSSRPSGCRPTRCRSRPPARRSTRASR